MPHGKWKQGTASCVDQKHTVETAVTLKLRQSLQIHLRHE